jgi:hypothetical protein
MLRYFARALAVLLTLLSGVPQTQIGPRLWGVAPAAEQGVGNLIADSDEAGRVFRFESGHHSDLKAAGVGTPSGSLG